jgi:hypothetical protein
MFYTHSRYPDFLCLCFYLGLSVWPSVPSIRHLQFPFCLVLSLFDAFLSDIGIGSGSVSGGGVEKPGEKAIGKKNIFFWFGFGMDWIGVDWIGLIFIFIWLDA